HRGPVPLGQGPGGGLQRASPRTHAGGVAAGRQSGKIAGMRLSPLALFAVVVALPVLAYAQPEAGEDPAPTFRLDIDAARALMAVEQLDGWLLTGDGGAANDAAAWLVDP